MLQYYLPEKGTRNDLQCKLSNSVFLLIEGAVKVVVDGAAKYLNWLHWAHSYSGKNRKKKREKLEEYDLRGQKTWNTVCVVRKKTKDKGKLVRRGAKY